MTIVAVALTLQISSAFGSDGDVDLSFDPSPEATRTSWFSMNVIDRRLYLARAGYSPIRLNEDGSLDPSFPNPIPGPNPSIPLRVSEVIGLPSGELVILDSRSVYTEDRLGNTLKLGGPAGFTASIKVGSAFAFDNGSSVYINPSGAIAMERFTPQRQFDWRFHRAMELSSLKGTQFDDGAGSGHTGTMVGLSTIAAKDTQDRIILIGNLHTAGSAPAFGLVRILPDGTLDPTWNPGPELGIGINEDGYLTALPVAVAVAPDGTTLVLLRFISSDGLPNFQFAVINDQGNVETMFSHQEKATMNYGPPALIAQPDGKFLVGWWMKSWQGAPVTGLVRILADGSLDRTFEVELTRADGEVLVWSMVLDDRGRLSFLAHCDTVNGVSRPGLARVFAFTPPTAAPQIQVTAAPSRIALNEDLILTADVDGFPPASLQWYRNGEALAGQTHRGLRLPIVEADDIGEFKLVATNEAGTTEAVFPPVDLAARSPKPGDVDPEFDRTFAGLLPAAPRMWPMSNGKILAAGGTLIDGGRHEMVVRLTSELLRDDGFGDGGAVSGDGRAERLRMMRDGDILVAGDFSELGGHPAPGIALLSPEGRVLARDFPALDVPHITVALPLPDGKYMISGKFSTVDGVSVPGLARLNTDLTLDLSFDAPAELFLAPAGFESSEVSIVDMAVDSQGRLLIAAGVVPRNNSLRMPTGIRAFLYRLLVDGSIDQDFDSTYRPKGPTEQIFVEPDGTIVMPYARLTSDGAILMPFEQGIDFGPLFPLPDGGFLSWKFADHQPVTSYPTIELIRWHTNGSMDHDFSTVLDAPQFRNIDIRTDRLDSVAGLADGSILLALTHADLDESLTSEERQRLIRIQPDSDLRLQSPEVEDGRFRAMLATQPGRTYQIYRRDDVSVDESSLVIEISGDGYVHEVSLPADSDSMFLELRRSQVSRM